MADLAAFGNRHLHHKVAVGVGLPDGRDIAQACLLDRTEIHFARLIESDLNRTSLLFDGIIRPPRPIENQSVAVGMGTGPYPDGRERTAAGSRFRCRRDR
jgi:hypothetical protein